MLLLDEPLTGLDFNSAKTIDSIIHEEPERGGSVVLTTHDIEEARAANHVILTDGRVVASGHPEEVLTATNLATAYGLGSLHEQDVAALLFPTEHHDPNRCGHLREHQIEQRCRNPLDEAAHRRHQGLGPGLPHWPWDNRFPVAAQTGFGTPDWPWHPRLTWPSPD